MEPSYCKHCGLEVVRLGFTDWQHADGYLSCPPGFDALAEPEEA